MWYYIVVSLRSKTMTLQTIPMDFSSFSFQFCSLLFSVMMLLLTTTQKLSLFTMYSVAWRVAS